MNSLILLIIMVIALFFIFKVINNNRTNKKKISIMLLSFIAIIFLLNFSMNIYGSNSLPNFGYAPKKVLKQHIMNLNEIKTTDDTKITLKRALLDLNNISATYSVSGKCKVIAVELKKNPQDEKPLSTAEGLWVGKRFIKDNNSLGFSFNSKEYLSPLYLTFHLSSGNSITFEIKDTTGIDKLTESIALNEKVNFKNDNYIKLLTFNKALNSYSIDFQSNIYNIKDILDIKVIIDDKEYNNESYGFSSNGSLVEGSFAYKPIKGKDFKLKILNKKTQEEKIINIR